MTVEIATLPEPLSEVAPPRNQHGAVAWLLWLARRIGLAVLTLWLVSVLVFVATAALGDPVRAILGKDFNANKARADQLTALLHANEPLVQRYLHWLGGLFTGDLGSSLANQQSVSSQIGS